MSSRERVYFPDGRPQPFVIRGDDGRWSFDPDDIVECGYTPTGITGRSDQVGLGGTQAAARKLDVTMSSLQAWRTRPNDPDNEFEFYLIPGWTKGYCGSPLLPF